MFHNNRHHRRDMLSDEIRAEKAIEFKEDRCRGYARQGLSHVTKKYVDAARNKKKSQ